MEQKIKIEYGFHYNKFSNTEKSNGQCEVLQNNFD